MDIPLDVTMAVTGSALAVLSIVSWKRNWPDTLTGILLATGLLCAGVSFLV